MNWDDLRYILAVARHGTISEGAKALRVNVSTVSRRLRGMEEAAGTVLFKKLKHGVVLTVAGEEMVAVAEDFERMTHDLDARINGLDTRLEGKLRVTSVPMLCRLWIEDMGAFHLRNPGIELEVVAGFEVHNLTQREADVAFRIAASAPDHLIGRKYAQILFAIYGSHELVEKVGAGASYSTYPWALWDLAFSRNTDIWLEKHHPGARTAIRVNTMPVMVSALEAGLGITILPCFVGDSNPRLRRVGDYFEGGQYLWVLTHSQLRGAARVRNFIAFMREVIERDKDLLEGHRPGSLAV